MGMCLKDFGRVSIEVRRESFIIHPNDEAWSPTHCRKCGARYQASPDDKCLKPGEHVWTAPMHPEFYLSDLDDLIKSLEAARDYLRRRKK